MCEKGKRLKITTNSFTKIDQHDRFCLLWQAGWENSAIPGTNQNAGFVEFCPLMSREKIKYFFSFISNKI